MNKRIIILMAAALALLSASGQVRFIGGSYPVLAVASDKSVTGLDSIFVVYDIDGVGMVYSSPTGERPEWVSFEKRGNGLVFEDVQNQWNGFEATLPQIEAGKGYIIDNRFYCWVVNYADYRMSLTALYPENDQPCDLLTIRVDGVAHKIPYLTTRGETMVLDRQLELTYETQTRGDSTEWEITPVTETFESLDEPIVIDQPLCDTKFRLTGDQFLRRWKNWGLEEESAEYVNFVTQAVDCASIAVQLDVRNNTNEKKSNYGQEDKTFGGSAPIRILFTGFPTYAVRFREWQMATDPEFENIIMEFYQDEVDYTFSETGTYYMRYKVANGDGSCEAPIDDEIYTIIVSESRLDCPNVFSPGSTEEVNDIWKVSYKSLVEFHCWIFNRWGKLLYEFTDPSGGWDGYYNGRLVDTGVYYYVIEALGSDGIRYNPTGAISILRYSRGESSGGTGL